MRRSISEGVVYAVMVGLAELFFVPDAVRLGAGPLAIGLLVGLPLAMGAAGAAVGLRVIRWSRGRRRPVVVGGVLCQALVLCGLATGEALAVSTPTVLIAAASAYHFCAQLVAGPWSAWLGDIVPSRIRGRYFSSRTRAVHLTSFVSLLVGGLVLEWLQPPVGVPGGIGFAVLFAGAALARLVSAALLASTPEGHTTPHEPAKALSLRPRWKSPVDRLLLGTGVVFLAVYVGSPYFTPFMFEELRLDYAQYTIASAAMVACKVLSLRRWGQAVDRHGATAVYRLAIILLALLPLPWLFVEGLLAVVLAQGLSGFSWAAHEIAFFSLVLETTESAERPRAYALQSISTGLGQLAGAMLGAYAILAHIDFRELFAFSSGLRFIAALGVAWALAEAFRNVGIGRRRLLLRVVGLRVSGGAIHRPLNED